MTTYDENGGYPHPDHIRCHQVSVAAYEAAGDYRRFPDAGPGGRSPSCTTTTDFCASGCRCCRTNSPSTARRAVREVAQALGSRRTTSFAGPGDHEHRVLGVLRQRDDALRAHATQIDPNGDFFAAPIEWQQRLWPTEEFELARSRVPVRLPETDLFAGIEDERDRHADGRARSSGRRRAAQHGPDFGKASPFGLLVVVMLLIARAVSGASMNRHLKKLPESFDPSIPSRIRPSTTARSMTADARATRDGAA